ncbi:MAG: methylated-DNA--[protein]-cysteine S-methyltransferase [Eubacteriales bacterium]|nr:methylated-DNA--[protein]-cysteine S-methyltransferase [Eubacteriales bacterium]
MRYCYMASPVGRLLLFERDGAIERVEFDRDPPQGAIEEESALLSACQGQLREYFAGERRRFELLLRPLGTPFQRACWQALQQIPYGRTCSYADIARSIGRPKACRAVGGANHVNPISIIIPCHRVIGASGALVGYGGGLPIKEYLLCLERENI